MDLRTIFSTVFGLWEPRLHQALGQEPNLPYMKGGSFVEPFGNGVCGGIPDGHQHAVVAVVPGGAAGPVQNSGTGGASDTADKTATPECAA